MALTTRCPHCHTAFKVVADQLRVRNGLVRCGACGTVFDGRACLEGEQAPAIPAYVASSQASTLVNNPPALQTPVPSAPAVPSMPVAPRPPVAPVAAPTVPAAPVAPVAPSWPPAVPPAVLRGRDRHPAEPIPEPDDEEYGREDDEPAALSPIRAYDPEDYPPAHDEPEFVVGAARDDDDADDDAAGGHVYGDVRTRFSSATDVGRAPPEFLDRDRINTHRTWRRVWAWLCLLALLALAGQLTYVYRTPVALAAPVLRPALTRLCASMGCTVGYARRIERIFIESSSLRPPQGVSQTDEAGRSRLILAAVLRNRYDKDQEWPAVALSLTDMSDTVIARKIIRPEDYLPPGTTGPMAAGAEVTISVPIVVSGLQVNGYQLDKFFP